MNILAIQGIQPGTSSLATPFVRPYIVLAPREWMFGPGRAATSASKARVPDDRACACGLMRLLNRFSPLRLRIPPGSRRLVRLDWALREYSCELRRALTFAVRIGRGTEPMPHVGQGNMGFLETRGAVDG